MATFSPDWISSPGDTITDILLEREIDQAHFGEMMRLTDEDVTALLEGRISVTLSMAQELAAALGSTAEFWMARDFQFRDEASMRSGAAAEWVRELPLGDMVRFGWMAPTHPTEEAAACLRFFAVPTVSAWRNAYDSTLAAVAFRTSPSFESRPPAVAAWLRQGEREAERIVCAPWNREAFVEHLDGMRSLTRQRDPQRFLPTLRRECADSGVAVVVVRSPAGSRASGAVRFVSKEKAVIQLSARHLTDDQFWFSFFHECGHLLLHPPRLPNSSGSHAIGILELDGTPDDAPDEVEANHFAQRLIISEEHQAEFERLAPDVYSIIRFAVKVGVAPGLVVGQLQHQRRVAYDRLNRLKRRYTWND